MTLLCSLLRRLARDERASEVLEYALILGLIIITAITVIASVGTKAVARWNVVNSGL